MNTATEVLAENVLWSCEEADAVAWLKSLPDDSIDLLFTSPPYEKARTYGIGDKMVGGQDWVDWMVEVVRAAAPKVKGLIAINCEGQTRNYAYSGVPFLLFADLHRAGFNMRKPPVFHRVGIPGSGGPDWLRNDYEPIICMTRPGRVPWSDNTAYGHPPKYGPGGEMSHRNKEGIRKGYSCLGPRGGNIRQKDGSRKEIKQKFTKKMYSRNPDGERDEDEPYIPPELANPGNVIKIEVGGGKMGSPHAHNNEAPFPQELPTFFIRSFCPPGGVCCDPFGGSGTTIDAAVQCGRRGISCDLRASQVALAHRRMRNCTPPLFAES